MFEKKNKEKKEQSVCNFPLLKLLDKTKTQIHHAPHCKFAFYHWTITRANFDFDFSKLSAYIDDRSRSWMQWQRQQQHQQQRFDEKFFLHESEWRNKRASNIILTMFYLCLCVSRVCAVECRYIYCFACAADFLNFLVYISSIENLLILNLNVNYVCNEHFLACIRLSI